MQPMTVSRKRRRTCFCNMTTPLGPRGRYGKRPRSLAPPRADRKARLQSPAAEQKREVHPGRDPARSRRHGQRRPCSSRARIASASRAASSASTNRFRLKSYQPKAPPACDSSALDGGHPRTDNAVHGRGSRHIRTGSLPRSWSRRARLWNGRAPWGAQRRTAFPTPLVLLRHTRGRRITRLGLDRRRGWPRRRSAFIGRPHRPQTHASGRALMPCSVPHEPAPAWVSVPVRWARAAQRHAALRLISPASTAAGRDRILAWPAHETPEPSFAQAAEPGLGVVSSTRLWWRPSSMRPSAGSKLRSGSST